MVTMSSLDRERFSWGIHSMIVGFDDSMRLRKKKMSNIQTAKMIMGGD